MQSAIESAYESMIDEELDDLLKRCNQERKIKYDVCFARPNNFVPKEIEFSKVNDYDFSKGFTEFIISND